jgi:hypothetical protein
MGCGASRAVGTLDNSRAVEKDPEDYDVEEVELRDTKLEKFNEFFQEAADPINILIEANNILNDAVSDIKDAVALVSGALKVKLRLAPDTDIVHVDVVKAADGKPASSDDIAKVLSKAEAADSDLAKALIELNRQLESSPSSSLSCSDGQTLSGDASGVAAVNSALKALGAALGGDMKLDVKVKKAAAPGKNAVKVDVLKPYWADDETETPELRPASLLDMRKFKTGDKLLKALIDVPRVADGLTTTMQNVDAKVEFINNRKIAKFKGTSSDKEVVKAIAKATGPLNSAIYKVVKEAAYLNGEISILSAVKEVLKALKAKVKKMTSDAAKSSFSVEPKIEINIEEPSFDLDFEIKFEQPDLDLPPFPECLPGRARVIYNAILAVKDKVMEIAEKVKELPTQIEEATSKGQELAENAQADFEEAGLGVFEIPGAIANIAMNLKELASKGVEVGKKITENLQRVVQEFYKIKNELPSFVAELKQMV